MEPAASNWGGPQRENRSIPKLHNYQVTQSGSGFFQLGILLHQLLQPEPWELYRNLGVFPISFALVDGALAVLGMFDLLAGAEAALALGFLDHGLGEVELLAARREKLGNVIDGVVALAGIGRL